MTQEYMMQKFDVNHGYQPIFIERYKTLENGNTIVLTTRLKMEAQLFNTAQASGVAKHLSKNLSVLYVPVLKEQL